MESSRLKIDDDNDVIRSSLPASAGWVNANMVFWALGVAVLLCLNTAAVLYMYPLRYHHPAAPAPTGDVHAHVAVEYWVLQEAPFTRLCSTKNILTMNGMFPGPALYLRRGQRTKVNVQNQGKYGVTIHWHGVKQPRNPWSDGAEFITQCKIEPGFNYTYEIILSDEEGTLWWHAHSDWSRATVHGPIFIYPEEGRPYPFPKPYKEVPIVLASWYTSDVMTDLFKLLASGGGPILEDAFTINGQPGDVDHPCSFEEMFRLPVEYGKTYLLRIVNAALCLDMFFMIANHNLTVVAIDASYIKPINTGYIMIASGQTMDVLFTTNQSPNQNYYMVASAYEGLDYVFRNASALVQYTTNDTQHASFPLFPISNDTATALSFTSQFRALNTKEYPINVPKTIQRRIFITLTVGTLPCEAGNNCTGANDQRFTASMNNITVPYPKMSNILESYYNKIEGVYKNDFPDKPENPYNYTMNPMLTDKYIMQDINGTRVIEIDYGTNVEIVFQNTNVRNSSVGHPMHMHGYSFYQVGWGHENFNESIDPETYNLEDPPLVNTIQVPKLGWVAIRFTANNPGVWFMHCHLEPHEIWGMDVALIVKNGPTPETSIRPPPDYIVPCYNNNSASHDLALEKETIVHN